MFSIDLLKGKNRPVKSSLKKSLLKMAMFLLPLMAVAAWAASYRQDCAVLQERKAQIQENQIALDNARQSLESYRHLNAQINDVKNTLKSITKGLSYRIQVTDILVELVQTLPPDIFIHEIDMQRNVRMVQPEQEEGKGEKIPVIHRVLTLTLCGYDPVQSDRQVRDYVDHLKNSEVLADIFTDVRPAARHQGTVDQRPATYYEIECAFQEQK